jgi:putative ABC transport system substrate-binding protein
MRRREFIILSSAGATLWPLAVRAQAPAGKRPVIGVLALNASEANPGNVKVFIEALGKLGYVDGKTATIVKRYAAGEQPTLSKLAGELVGLKPDVIVADTPSSIKAVAKAASKVPIVGVIMGSPVKQGLITSFAHPGGNITGLASQVEDVIGKLLEYGLELVPAAKDMGLLVDSDADNRVLMRSQFQEAAEKRGIGFHVAEAHDPDQFDAAVRQLADAGAAYICVTPSGQFNLHIRRIAEAALKAHLPTITNRPEMVDTGILLAYGVDYAENFQRAATFVDKILKGANPGDLPVEFTTKLELIINLKTAKALGIALPKTLIATADQVIE